MNNQERQADEILVLKSIFDKKFRVLGDNQYEISIEFEFIQPITIEYNNKKCSIDYLPPFTLIIHNHDEYPSVEPPSFILSCFYLSKHDLKNLCQKLDNYPFKNEVCVYDWIDIIKNEITNKFIFNNQLFDELNNDPRALNGYTNENLNKIYQYLINYNSECINKQFENQFQTCLICTDTLPGNECIRLNHCQHFYCRICLNNYVQMTLNNGQFGEKLHCPQSQCKQVILPTEIKQILQTNTELYERYERITLQNTLASMNDIVWCPRCQSAVLTDSPDDNLAICYQCRYTFCRTCREIFHSQTMCPRDYRIQQIKLQQEKEREKIEKQKEEARLEMEKIQQNKKSSEEQKIAKEKYRRIIIKLSEEDKLLEDILNAERIESLNTQSCPKCHVRIEKNGGCSHMHCSQCNYDFTWQTITKTDQSTNILLLNNPEEIQSVKEQLNKTTNIVNTTEENIEQIENQDLEISIDNKSSLGSTIVKRVRQCPHRLCKRLNVKIDQDNWIVCNGCMKQFCFLCGRAFHGANHFEKKCQRYTRI